MSNIFGTVTVAATVVNGVKIPEFKAPTVAVYIVSQLEGSAWEQRVVGPVITAVQQNGAAAEAEAVALATTEANKLITEIKNPILDAILEATVDPEISALVGALFGAVLSVVTPKT